MKQFAAIFAALALLAALGRAVPPETKNIPTAETATCPAADAPVSLSGHGDSPSERKIREALNQPAQFDFVKTPLKDVADSLKKSHQIEIQLDSPALKEAGVDESTPVTKTLKGISLRSALKLLLDELQLKYVIHNEVLLITSPTKAESDEYMEIRVYPVTDLVLPDRDGSVDFGPLKDVLTNTVATKTWLDYGGTGTLSEIVIGNRLLLVASQTQEVHEEIEDILKLLRKAAGLKPAAPRVALNEAAERQIRDALNQPAQFDFVKTPLKDVVNSLKNVHHIEVQLDSAALREAGVDESTPVTRRLKGISLRSALRLILDELELKCVVHNGVLMITSPTKAESDEYMENRGYAVPDLVSREPDGVTNFEPLANLLTNTVATKTWVDNGGTGTLSKIVVGNRPLLVILQTQEVHEEIENTLAMIRMAGGLKPAAQSVAVGEPAPAAPHGPLHIRRPPPPAASKTGGGTGGQGGGMGGLF